MKIKLHNKKNPIILNLFNYLKKPQPKQLNNLSTAQKLWNTIRLWGLQFIIALGLGIIITIVLSLFNLENTQHAIPENFNKDTAVMMLIYGGFIAPVIEEMTFRLPLKYRPINIGLFISFQIIFIFNQLLGLSDNLSSLNKTISNNILITIGIYLLFITITTLFVTTTLMLVERNLNLKKKLQKKIHKFYPIFFYFISLYFGLMHILNYADFNKIWFLTLILVSPQIVIGLFLGFIRTQYGLFWAILNHIIHNSITLIPFTLILLFTSINPFAAEQNFQQMNSPDLILIFLSLSILLGAISIAGILVIQSLIETGQHIVESR